MFGISPRSRNTSAPLWWGARAIFHVDYDRYSGNPKYTLDIPWDRRQTTPYIEDGAEQKALWFWLDNYGMPALRVLLKKEAVTTRDDKDLVVESHGFKLVANPNGSCGYLYIGAWPTSADVKMPPPPPPKKEAPPEPAKAAPRRSSTFMDDDEFSGGRRRQ